MFTIIYAGPSKEKKTGHKAQHHTEVQDIADCGCQAKILSECPLNEIREQYGTFADNVFSSFQDIAKPTIPRRPENISNLHHLLTDKGSVRIWEKESFCTWKRGILQTCVRTSCPSRPRIDIYRGGRKEHCY